MSQDNKEKNLICFKCNVTLVEAKVDFKYLEKAFHANVLKCPSCGKACIMPELAEGKMAETERLLEEK